MTCEKGDRTQVVALISQENVLHLVSHTIIDEITKRGGDPQLVFPADLIPTMSENAPFSSQNRTLSFAPILEIGELN